MGLFSAQVSEFTEQTKKDIPLIFNSAISKLEFEMKRNRKTGGGLTPADTGNLIRSIKVSDKAMPKVDTVEKKYRDTTFTLGPNSMSKPVYIGVKAVYGPRMNYGFVGADKLGRNYNMTGAYFVEGAASKWKQFVKEAEAEFAK